MERGNYAVFITGPNIGYCSGIFILQTIDSSHSDIKQSNRLL